ARLLPTFRLFPSTTLFRSSVLVLVAFLFVLVRWFDDRMETAIAAFAAGRLDEAETTFQDVLEDAPEDVTVLLYLGRINRRQGDQDRKSTRLNSSHVKNSYA